MFQPMGMQRHHEGPAMNPIAVNQQQRSIVLGNAINRWQQIFSQTFTATNLAGTVVNVPVKNVGLIKRFIVQVQATVTRAVAETQNRTPWGPANFFSQIVLNDLDNYTRIQTTGWHLFAVQSARRMMAYGSAYTNDSPVQIGAVNTVISAPAAFGAGSQTINVFFEVPMAYGDFDLRGGMFAGVLNATASLQFTINPSFFVASTATSNALAGYQSTTTDLGLITSATITVWQNYLDQLPRYDAGPMKGQFVLPEMDMQTVYLLQNTALGGLTVNQANGIPYANMRQFLSTFLMYDNQGLLAGTDISQLSLQSANFTNIWQVTPAFNFLLTRNMIADDFPRGVHYFDHRVKPISTDQYGNMQLLVTPSSVAGSASQFLVGFESMGFKNQIARGGSLPST